MAPEVEQRVKTLKKEAPDKELQYKKASHTYTTIQ